MISLKESILKSNFASHPAYRFSLYGDDKIVSILVSCNNIDAIPRWNRKKVRETYNNLNNVYKKDIRYSFNRHSQSKDKILTYLWCIISACKNYDEVERVCKDLLDNSEYKIDKIGSIGGATHENLRIAFKNHYGYSTISFYIHDINEYTDYRYVK